jgi:hypothetical protein
MDEEGFLAVLDFDVLFGHTGLKIEDGIAS